MKSCLIRTGCPPCRGKQTRRALQVHEFKSPLSLAQKPIAVNPRGHSSDQNIASRPRDIRVCASATAMLSS
jgi:hypothetical protein